MDALQFLEHAEQANRHPVSVLLGDEDFLKWRCRDALIPLLIGDTDPTFAVTTYPGDKLDFSTVQNDLSTLSFFSPSRVVIVEQADPFITEHRAALERYVQKPSPIGFLILEVKSFPESTKLARALPDEAKIVCKAPPTYKLTEWCVGWSKAHHRKKLSADAAQLLVELVGAQLGLLDQELEKLAVSIGKQATIESEDVDRWVGRSRNADVFRIMDAIGEGKAGEALSVLAELFEKGEEPLAILGPLTYQLRRLATVGRIVAGGQSLGTAMDGAGIPKWPMVRQSLERQVKFLGLRRLNLITEWLLEINLGIKGGSPLSARLQLEHLIVRLARPRTG